MSAGVDVTFFSEAVKLLGRQHGRRLIGDQGKLNDLIAALALVEETWKSMPPVPSGDKMTACPEGRSQEDERREAAVG
jgi:hypothetical protein